MGRSVGTKLIESDGVLGFVDSNVLCFALYRCTGAQDIHSQFVQVLKTFLSFVGNYDKSE